MLEGIALVGDPDFALVDEAFPYISKRLMTDDSPRLREALRYMVYGKNSTFDAERLVDLLEAFETFSEASKSARGNLDLSPSVFLAPDSSSSGGGPPAPFGRGWEQPGSSNPIFGGAGGLWDALVPASMTAGLAAPLMALSSPMTMGSFAGGVGGGGVGGDSQRTREALKFVLSPEGAFFREFLLDEAVKSVDALSRDQFRQLLTLLGLQDAMVPVLLPGAARCAAGLPACGSDCWTGLGSPADAALTACPRAARRLFMPLAPSLEADDQRVVENVATVIKFLTGGSSTALSAGRLDPTMVRDLLPFLPSVATQILPELSSRLFSRITARFVREVFI